jgi:hypothetical protein
VYGLAAVLGGVLFVISDYVAFLIEPPDGFDRAPTWEAWAAWAALSLISFALLQVALVGLYRSQRTPAAS